MLPYKDNTVFVKKEEQNISFLKFSEVVSVYPEAKETFIYLFSIDKVSYYLIPELPEALFSNYHFENNRLFRTARPKDLAFAGITICPFSPTFTIPNACFPFGGNGRRVSSPS